VEGACCALLWTCWGGVSVFLVSLLEEEEDGRWERNTNFDRRGTAERVLELVQKAFVSGTSKL
jgi:hypothetical protein